MTDPLSLKLVGVPSRVAVSVDVISQEGIYFGSNYLFTANDESGRYILIAAAANMLAGVSRPELEKVLASMTINDATIIPMGGARD